MLYFCDVHIKVVQIITPCMHVPDLPSNKNVLSDYVPVFGNNEFKTPTTTCVMV